MNDNSYPAANSAADIIELCYQNRIPLSEYAVRSECERSGMSPEEVRDKMHRRLDVMGSSISEARKRPVYSVSGLTGGDAERLERYLKTGKTLSGETALTAMAGALSAAEVNSAMGRIAACPTAGSCGIVPAALEAARERLGLEEEAMLDGLLAASAVGLVIGSNATFAGSEGGCQAECGSASAMAAGGIVAMAGGSPKQSFDAAAIALKSVMGLVCDPVAGLVEIPCAKRNAMGAVQALAAADMALARIESKIPFDEVLEAAVSVGRMMPEALRETSNGGLAVTPTALRMREHVFGEEA